LAPPVSLVIACLASARFPLVHPHHLLDFHHKPPFFMVDHEQMSKWRLGNARGCHASTARKRTSTANGENANVTGRRFTRGLSTVVDCGVRDCGGVRGTAVDCGDCGGTGTRCWGNLTAAPSSRFPPRAATIFMEPNTRNRRVRRERHPGNPPVLAVPVWAIPRAGSSPCWQLSMLVLAAWQSPCWHFPCWHLPMLATPMLALPRAGTSLC